jgi:hypothetical protein
MKTWKDVEFLYYDIAGRYTTRWPQFQADELVDEAWIVTYPFINYVKGLACMVHRAMMGYIRKNLTKYHYKKVGNSLVQDTNKPILIEYLDDLEPQKYTKAFSIIDNEFEDVDVVDYFDIKLSTLPVMERIILYMKYEWEMTFNEIGRLLNYTGERIRQIYNAIIKKVAFI